MWNLEESRLSELDDSKLVKLRAGRTPDIVASGTLVPPTAVRGNDWRSLPVAPPDVFEPARSASVVVPYYEAADALALTLAGLERQTYPRELFEVIVVDDGSDPPLELVEPTPMQLRVIHQEDLGFGAARARNNGARAAEGDILAFLDCDMIPEAGWLAAHTRWHHAVRDAVSLGFRRHVETVGVDAQAVRDRPDSLADLFAGRPTQSPQWIERRMARTDDLTAGTEDIYRVVTGGNFAVSAEFFAEVGGFDDSFTQWGDEDIEFGWRAYALGAVLVPERRALCWHQGHGAALSAAERASLAQQREKVSHLIPDRRIRSAKAGRSFTVPEVVVSVDPGHCDEDAVQATVEQVLASDVHDLVVWVEERPAERFDSLRRLFGGDPRVDVGTVGGAPSAHPAAAFHVRLPAGAPVKRWTVRRLRAQLGAAAAGQSDLASGHRATITRSWALNRSRRGGLDVRDVGTVVELDVDSLRIGQQPQPENRLAACLQGPAKILMRAWPKARRRLGRLGEAGTRILHHLSRLLRAAVGIRDRQDLRRFLSTLAQATRWRWLKLGKKARWALKRRLRRAQKRATAWLGLQASTRPHIPRLAQYPLGAEIAVSGRAAAAVFSASARVGAPTGDRHVDLLLVDSPEASRAVAEDMAADAQPAVAVLEQMDPPLRVQAFDAEAVNPIGWCAACEPESPTLRSVLPRTSGVLRHLMSGDTLAGLRAPHHLLDHAKFHQGAPQRAAALAALAAAGVLVHITDRDETLEQYLGPGLHGLMADERVPGAGAHEREQLGIAMRRHALRDHSLRSRARQVLGAAGIDVPPPEVSILAPTRRPERLGPLLNTIGAQTYPRLELVLALHGDGFAADAEIAALAGALRFPVQVVRVDGAAPLGAVLRAAAAGARAHWSRSWRGRVRSWTRRCAPSGRRWRRARPCR